MSFIDDRDFPAGLVLRVLGIASSTYYGWRVRAASPPRRHRENAELLQRIRAIRCGHEFAATCGSPRVRLELRREGVRCPRKRVERIMRAHGLVGAHLRRGWKHGSTRQNSAHTKPPAKPGNLTDPWGRHGTTASWPQWADYLSDGPWL